MIKIERNNKKFELSNGSLALIFLIVATIAGGIITVVSVIRNKLTATDWANVLIVIAICITIIVVVAKVIRLSMERIETGHTYAKSLDGIKGDIKKIKKILEQTEE